MPMTDPTRRRFLEMLGASAASAATAAGCSHDPTASEATGDLAGGNVSAFAIGTLTVLAGHPVVVARDGDGLYAMSTICTHEQCDMTASGKITNGGMSCSCHGSTFDANGNPTGGPARSTVRHFAVELKDGVITVHADTIVAPTTRVAVQ